MKIKSLHTNIPIRSILRWLWRSSADNRLQAVLNTVIGLLETVVSLASVWAMKNAIDIASQQVGLQEPSGAVPASLREDLMWAIAIMAGLILSTFALRVASVWVRNILGIKAQNRMQQRMLSRILHSQYQGRDALHSGDVLNRLEQDVATVVNFVAETLPDILSIFTLFLGAFGYLFILDYRLALVIVILFPLFLLLSKLYVGRMRQLNRDVRESDSMVQSILQDSVQNRLLVKSLESEDSLVDRLDDEHRILRRKVVKKTYFSVFSNVVVSMGFATGYLVAFGWSAFRLAAGTLTYGGMTAFLQLVNRIQGPARNLARTVPKFVAVFTAAERLMMFEDIPLEEEKEPQLLDGCCGVEFSDVSFAYADEPDKMILSHFSFDFRPGTCTAVTGRTGAGKTTLLRMILAILAPVSGRVYIYNKVERMEASPSTRCNIIYVPQGNTLLSGTIRDNLLLGNPDATEAEMHEALRMACADFVADLPGGIDTVVTENGGGLSEGQAQRICIARALLRKSSLMILDEATSALDEGTERQLLKNLFENKTRTVIFITHRPAVLKYCDAHVEIDR